MRLRDEMRMYRTEAREYWDRATTTCLICYDREANMAALPCGHLTTCFSCSRAYIERPCPICRVEILLFIPVYDARVPAAFPVRPAPAAYGPLTEAQEADAEEAEAEAREAAIATAEEDARMAREAQLANEAVHRELVTSIRGLREVMRARDVLVARLEQQAFQARQMAQVCCICVRNPVQFIAIPCGCFGFCFGCRLRARERCPVCDRIANFYTVVGANPFG